MKKMQKLTSTVAAVVVGTLLLCTSVFATPAGSYDGSYQPGSASPPAGQSTWTELVAGTATITPNNPSAGIARFVDDANGVTRFSINRDTTGQWDNPADPTNEAWFFEAKLKYDANSFIPVVSSTPSPGWQAALGFKDEGGSGKTMMLGWLAYKTTSSGSVSYSLRLGGYGASGWSFGSLINSINYFDGNWHVYRMEKKFNSSLNQYRYYLYVDGALLSAIGYNLNIGLADVTTSSGFTFESNPAGGVKAEVDYINYGKYQNPGTPKDIYAQYDGSYDPALATPPSHMSTWIKNTAGGSISWNSPSSGLATLSDTSTSSGVGINFSLPDDPYWYGQAGAIFYRCTGLFKMTATGAGEPNTVANVIFGFRDEGGLGKRVQLGFFRNPNRLALIDASGNPLYVLNNINYFDGQTHKFAISKSFQTAPYAPPGGAAVAMVYVDDAYYSIPIGYQLYSNLSDDSTSATGFELATGSTTTASVVVDKIICGPSVFPTYDLTLDYRIYLEDLSVFTPQWVMCTDPNNPECDTAPDYVLNTPTTLAYWQLDEDSANFVDAIGGKNLVWEQGTRTNTGIVNPIPNPDSGPFTTGTPAENPYAQYQVIGHRPTDADPNQNDNGLFGMHSLPFTVEGWYRIADTGGAVNYIIGDRHAVTNWSGWSVWVRDTGVLQAIASTAAGGRVFDIIDANSSADGNWHHFAFVWDPLNNLPNGNAKLYRDGKLIGSKSGVGEMPQLNGQLLTIGARNNEANWTFLPLGYYFQGDIDEIRFTRGVLTANQFLYPGQIKCGDWGYMDYDFNQDCSVDFKDFVQLAIYWATNQDKY